MKFLPVAALSLLVVAPAHAEDSRLTSVISKIDDLWRGRSSEAVMRMEVKTAHYQRKMKMRTWSKGKERSLVRILAPLKEKGTTTLKSGNSIYTYLPKTDRTIRLTSSMMLGSWMGSHFTNDDLVKESRLLDDYTAKLMFEGERGGKKIMEIGLLPKPDAAVVWGKITLWVEVDGLLPIKQIYYDEDLNVARTMEFSDVKEMGGRRLPASFKVVPADKPQEYTKLVYERISFNQDLSDSFFSVGRLRRR